MVQIKVGIARLNDGSMVAKAGTVIDQLTANAALFPAPVPSIAVLTAAKNALVTAMGEAEQGSKAAYIELRACRRTLKDLLNQAASYVSTVANGDEAKINAGGFGVREKPTPKPVPKAPVFDAARVSAYTGAVELKWAAKDARSYQVYMTEKDPLSGATEWTVIGAPTRRCFKYDGLESGKAYWFRVVAVGTAGVSPFSDVLLCRAG